MSYVCCELANADGDNLGNIINRLNASGYRTGPNAPFTEPPLPQRGAHGANVIKLIDREQRLFFYHVDSCLAIIFILNNGMVIGGHAAHPLDRPDGDGKPRQVISDMKLLIGEAQVTKIYLVGPLDMYPDIRNELREIPAPIEEEPQEKPANVIVAFTEGDWKIQSEDWVRI